MPATRPTLLQVAHAGDAGRDGQEDHRRDDHLDQLDEGVAQRLQRWRRSPGRNGRAQRRARSRSAPAHRVARRRACAAPGRRLLYILLFASGFSRPDRATCARLDLFPWRRSGRAPLQSPSASDVPDAGMAETPGISAGLSARRAASLCGFPPGTASPVRNSALDLPATCGRAWEERDVEERRRRRGHEPFPLWLSGIAGSRAGIWIAAMLVLAAAAGAVLIAGRIGANRAADELRERALAALPLAAGSLTAEVEKQRLIPKVLAQDDLVRRVLRPDGRSERADPERETRSIAGDALASAIYVIERTASRWPQAMPASRPASSAATTRFRHYLPRRWPGARRAISRWAPSAAGPASISSRRVDEPARTVGRRGAQGRARPGRGQLAGERIHGLRDGRARRRARDQPAGLEVPCASTALRRDGRSRAGRASVGRCRIRTAADPSGRRRTAHAWRKPQRRAASSRSR